MGCNFSNQTVRVAEPLGSDDAKVSEDVESSCGDKRSSVTKSHDSFPSSNDDSVESDKLTVHSYGSDILSPHRSKSVEFNRNGSANRDEPLPVGAATIIRSSVSAHTTPISNRKNNTEISLSRLADDATYSDATQTPDDRNELLARKKSLTRRRSSDGDVGKVTNVTCIPRTLIKANPILSVNLPDMKIRPPLFGPRNRRLTETQSQRDFFRMLDEKVDQFPLVLNDSLTLIVKLVKRST